MTAPQAFGGYNPMQPQHQGPSFNGRHQQNMISGCARYDGWSHDTVQHLNCAPAPQLFGVMLLVQTISMPITLWRTIQESFGGHAGGTGDVGWE